MRFIVMLLMIVVFASCVRNKNGQMNQSEMQVEGNSFEVVEVVQGNIYTYLKVREAAGEKWMAISRQEIEAGDVYYYDEGLQMTNFHSKEIDRTFEEIYFVSTISTSPITGSENAMGGMHGMGSMGAMPSMDSHQGKVETEKSSTISMEKSAGEITVAQIFADREKFSGKEIELRGIVVKVNKEIMGKNWIHIQDGTGDNGVFDLTVTSLDVAEVNDEVTLKGKITLNKDFGYGYSYDVIMEEATLVKTIPASTTM